MCDIIWSAIQLSVALFTSAQYVIIHSSVQSVEAQHDQSVSQMRHYMFSHEWYYFFSREWYYFFSQLVTCSTA